MKAWPERTTVMRLTEQALRWYLELKKIGFMQILRYFSISSDIQLWDDIWEMLHSEAYGPLFGGRDILVRLVPQHLTFVGKYWAPGHLVKKTFSWVLPHGILHRIILGQSLDLAGTNYLSAGFDLSGCNLQSLAHHMHWNWRQIRNTGNEI